MSDDSPARTLAELKDKQKLMRRPQLHKAVDIDGDGFIDDVEMELSKILDTIEGEDLDGDGIVTEAELNETKIRKGKEILARRFVQSHPGIHHFWADFKDLDEETMVREICGSHDYRAIMSNLENKAMQFELLCVDMCDYLWLGVVVVVVMATRRMRAPVHVCLPPWWRLASGVLLVRRRCGCRFSWELGGGGGGGRCMHCTRECVLERE